MKSRTQMKAWRLHASVGAAVLLCSAAVQAQTAATTATLEAPTGAATAVNGSSLRQIFDAAWARQPEALALPIRRDATRAKQRAAQAWTPEPMSLELSNKTDRLSRNQGTRELEFGVVVPLWLPGERGRSVALADAESLAIESRSGAAKLRLAAKVREAGWQWQRARIEVDMARNQLDSTRRVAADVARRAKAGDLARADQHQADGAVASAEASMAQSKAGLAAARQHLRALADVAPSSTDSGDALAEPDLLPVCKKSRHMLHCKS